MDVQTDIQKNLGTTFGSKKMLKIQIQPTDKMSIYIICKFIKNIPVTASELKPDFRDLNTNLQRNDLQHIATADITLTFFLSNNGVLYKISLKITALCDC